MAGLGGCIGYLLGGIDWDSLKFGKTNSLKSELFMNLFAIINLLFRRIDGWPRKSGVYIGHISFHRLCHLHRQ
jgi:hypothetical protein